MILSQLLMAWAISLGTRGSLKALRIIYTDAFLDSCKTLCKYITFRTKTSTSFSYKEACLDCTSPDMSPYNSASAKKMHVSHGSACPVDWPKVKIHLRTAESP